MRHETDRVRRHTSRAVLHRIDNAAVARLLENANAPEQTSARHRALDFRERRRRFELRQGLQPGLDLAQLAQLRGAMRTLLDVRRRRGVDGLAVAQAQQMVDRCVHGNDSD